MSSTFSYSGDPQSSILDAVRFEAQDTDSKAPLLTDGEIEYCAAQEAPNDPPTSGEVLGAAALAFEKLAQRFSLQADTEVGSLRTAYSKSATTIAQRALDLRKRAIMGNSPYFGGGSRSEKIALRQDCDRVQSSFRRDQFSRRSRNPASPDPFLVGDGAPEPTL